MDQKVLFVYLCMLFATTSIVAQTKTDTLYASRYYHTADSLLTDRKHDKSIIFFSKALRIYRTAKAWEKVTNCYNKISENQWRSRQLEKSLQNSKNALKISKTYLTKNNREEANTYDNIGKYYEAVPRYDIALNYYNKGLLIRQKLFPENHLDIARSYFNLALNYFDVAKYKQSLAYSKRSLAISVHILGPNHQKIESIYNNMGITYRSLGAYNEALSFLSKSLHIAKKTLGLDHINVGDRHLNIGAIYYELNQYDQALVNYQKALSIYSKQKNLKGLGRAYLNIGTICYEKRQYDKALQYFKKSLETKKVLYGDYHPENSTNYINIANVLNRIGNHKNAIYYYTKSLQIYKNTQTESHDDLAKLYENIGYTYVDEKEYDIALKYFKKSLSLYNKVFDKDSFKISRAYSGIAYTYHKKGMYTKALTYYKKKLKILKDTYGEKHLLNAVSYNNIGLNYFKLKEYTNALIYYDKAILVNTKNNDLKAFKNKIRPEDYFDLKMLLRSLNEKAKTLQSFYLDNNNIEYLNQSINIYQNADILIHHIRKSFQNHQDKVTLSTQTKEIYTDAIKAQFLLYNITKNQADIQQILYYTEKSKANTLEELLAETNAKNFSKLPKELITLEKTLKSNRAFYQSQILSEQSKDHVSLEKIRKLESSLFSINWKQDSLTNIVEKKYPKYYQLKYKNDLISVSEIQQQLDNKTTVLEFFTTYNSITYALTISKNDIGVEEIFIPELAKKVERLHKAITLEHITDYTIIAHELYQQLIASVKNKFTGNRLIIIPDGPLWHLNFDLLLTNKEKGKDSKKFSYLLRDHAISYANSTNLLFRPLEGFLKKSEIRKECLAFSFTNSKHLANKTKIKETNSRDLKNDLPGTRQEIKAISEIVEGQYYYGSEAIETNFKQNVSHYSILHLALHGEVDHTNPQNSRLYFTKNNDPKEDNQLYSHELFALDIPAELTVLSACNTGTGKIANGEGVLSLGTAFQYAGTKSLLLSHWEVSDKSTPQLMKNFYTNLTKGMNKAEALQKAKLTFLNTTEAFYTSPFYWGSFYLLGDTKAITLETNYTTYYWVLASILSLLLLFLLYMRRKIISWFTSRL